MNAVEDALRALAPPPEDPPDDRRSVREPDVLEDVVRRAGLLLRAAGEVGVPWDVPDRVSLERAFLVMDADRLGVPRDAARETILDSAALFRRRDGSYLFENRFRYVVAETASAPRREAVVLPEEAGTEGGRSHENLK